MTKPFQLQPIVQVHGATIRLDLDQVYDLANATSALQRARDYMATHQPGVAPRLDPLIALAGQAHDLILAAEPCPATTDRVILRAHLGRSAFPRRHTFLAPADYFQEAAS